MDSTIPHIALLVPTRGRPERFAEFVEAVNDTAAHRDRVSIWWGLDSDDPSLADYHAPLRAGDHGHLQPRMALGPWTNHLAHQALLTDVDILASLGDDHLCRTEGWDDAVRAAMAEIGPGGGLVYGDDLIQHEALPTAPFWSSTVIRACGWYCPPEFEHMFVDNWWLALATAIDRRAYLPEMVIEHCHPVAGTAAMDTTYELAFSRFDRDREVCERWGSSPEARAAIRRVEDALDDDLSAAVAAGVVIVTGDDRG